MAEGMMFTDAELKCWDERLEVDDGRKRGWDPDWRPPHFPQLPPPSPKVIRYDSSFDDLPWYKICKPDYRPEDPAIEMMRENLLQQQHDETAPPRSPFPSMKSSSRFPESLKNPVWDHPEAEVEENGPLNLDSDLFGNWRFLGVESPESSRVRTNEREELAPSPEFLESTEPFYGFPESSLLYPWANPDSGSNGAQSSALLEDLANKPQGHVVDEELGRQQMNDFFSFPAPTKLKRKADTSPSANKRVKIEAEESSVNPLSSSYHIPENKEFIDHYVEETVPNRLGVLARGIGQEVRSRANASGRKKAKRTAVTHAQLTTPPKVADIPNDGPERAELAHTTSKTKSKCPKSPAGTTLINPLVVIYRDPELHKQYAESPNNGETPRNSTDQSQQLLDASHARTKTQKKPSKPEVNQPLLNNKGRISKPSKPPQKSPRKTTSETAPKTHLHRARSPKNSLLTGNLGLYMQRQCKKIVDDTREMGMTELGEYMERVGYPLLSVYPDLRKEIMEAEIEPNDSVQDAYPYLVPSQDVIQQTSSIEPDYVLVQDSYRPPSVEAPQQPGFGESGDGPRKVATWVPQLSKYRR